MRRFIVMVWAVGIFTVFSSTAFALGGTFQQDMLQDEKVFVGTIPAGVQNFYVSLESDTDLDIELHNNGEVVVGWKVGLIDSYTEITGSFSGDNITWSGFDGVNGKKGYEWISISDISKNSYDLYAFGYRAGLAEIVYSYDSFAPTTNVSLYILNEGTAEFPKAEKIPVSYIDGKMNIYCEHGEEYSLVLEINVPDSDAYISAILHDAGYSQFYSTEEPIYKITEFSEISYNKFEDKNMIRLRTTACTHHATSVDAIKLFYSKIEYSYKKQPNTDIVTYGEINQGGVIRFTPKTYIVDVLKREPVFSTEFSPSNAVLAATLSELSYYPPEYVKNILSLAGFHEVMFYEELSSGVYLRDSQFYIAYKYLSNGTPVGYILARGTQETIDLPITDLSSLVFSDTLGTDSPDLERFGFSGDKSPYAQGFYEFGLYGFLAALTYPNPLPAGEIGKNIDSIPTGHIAAPYVGKAKLFITGHSLGGAAANILTTLLARWVDTDNMQTYTIGAPRSMGGIDNWQTSFINRDLASIVNNSDFNIFTIRHHEDLIPTVPFSISGYRHVGNLIGIYANNFGVVGTDGEFFQNQDDSDVDTAISTIDTASTHSSNVYINTLLQLEQYIGPELEEKASEDNIFERGSCIENKACYIHTYFLGFNGGVFLENIDNAQGQKSYQLLVQEHGNNAGPFDLGVYDKGLGESKSTPISLPNDINYESIMKNCRIYSNGNFTCFNVTWPSSEGEKTGNFYYELDNENEVYRLVKYENSQDPFYMLGVHQF